MSKEIKEEIPEVQHVKEERYGGVIPGTILIILGILFLLPRLGINFGNLWPTFILAPGLAFIIFYLVSPNRKQIAGILIPGVILTLIASFFYYQSFSDWANAEKLWPVYPLAVGIALYTFYIASGRKDRAILVPANILTLMGLAFLVLNYYSFNFWPLILIIVGLILILTSVKKERNKPTDKTVD